MEARDSWLSQQSPTTQNIMKHIANISFRSLNHVSSKESPVVVNVYAIFHSFLQPQSVTEGEAVSV
jgi:hypothetical protein